MFVTTVIVNVKPEYINSFIEECRKNHLNSVKEAGNCRFDILQSTETASSFMLYEAYESVQAAAEHKKTAHYDEWRNAVAQMMAEPRKGIPYISICP
jgi:(4S)-4-hydroxy-5-phosphonooxypentane-2,3-dione isomerase